ncbi:MAG: D-tyrosyl-tRNA(Tyr) deacylase [Alphaproteobacteria bacterium]|nr:D-tyrosyl-tRNA(Tyr) deacylase [Alphaproteobacteria bacterium]
MRAVVQRVREASVSVDGEVVGRCGRGLLILLAVASGDDEAAAGWMARKLAGLRIFPDDAGKMNLGLTDVSGEALVVSQFTLYGDCRKGRRPSFVGSAPPELADPLYQRFCALLGALGVPVQRGVFAADMQVSLVNDGPVTLIVDTP